MLPDRRRKLSRRSTIFFLACGLPAAEVPAWDFTFFRAGERMRRRRPVLDPLHMQLARRQVDVGPETSAILPASMTALRQARHRHKSCMPTT